MLASCLGGEIGPEMSDTILQFINLAVLGSGDK